MDRKQQVAWTGCLALLLTACATGVAARQGASYPEVLKGVWQGDGPTCQLPGNLDSDTRIEVQSTRLLDYEQWSEPQHIEQISSEPLAWRIRSRLHLDNGDVIDHVEIYAISGADKGQLTIIDSSRALSYARCR